MPEGRVAELATASRAWYGNHGAPWAAVRAIEIDEIDGTRVVLSDGRAFASRRVAARLRGGEAAATLAAAVSAGPEAEARARELWSADRPDESFFLDRFAVAVAERLATWTANELRRRARDRGEELLPGYSPGYDGWPLDDQRPLFEALTLAGRAALPGPLRLLDSLALAPTYSLLALFGTTRRLDLAARAWRRHKCSWCSLDGCQFRRAGGQATALGSDGGRAYNLPP